MFNVVLVEPRIAGNVGTIGRFCYNLGFELHIVGPHLLDYDDRKIMRAGLDYWWALRPRLYGDLDEFLSEHRRVERFFYASTKAQRYFCDGVRYERGDYLVFGSETYGLPQPQMRSLMSAHPDNVVKIPMKLHGRSLNIALSVAAIGSYALAQNIENFAP